MDVHHVDFRHQYEQMENSKTFYQTSKFRAQSLELSAGYNLQGENRDEQLDAPPLSSRLWTLHPKDEAPNLWPQSLMKLSSAKPVH